MEELRGIRSVHARQVYSRLLMNYYLMPCNKYFEMEYEQYLDKVESLESDELEQILKVSLSHCTIDKDDIISLCCFHRDANGLTISAESLANYGHDAIFDYCLKTLMAISKIKVFFYDIPKSKRSKCSQSTCSNQQLGFWKRILTRLLKR